MFLTQPKALVDLAKPNLKNSRLSHNKGHFQFPAKTILSLRTIPGLTPVNMGLEPYKTTKDTEHETKKSEPESTLNLPPENRTI